MQVSILIFLFAKATDAKGKRKSLFFIKHILFLSNQNTVKERETTPIWVNKDELVLFQMDDKGRPIDLLYVF